MKCSIVIRSYNEEKYIERLLLGIRAQSLEPHEVILVDSGSTDRTVDIALEHGVKLISIDKREFTFGRALNVGCAAATGDILVFASAHVYPSYSNWLETLVEPFCDERVVLSYGKQRGNRVSRFSERQIFSKWFPNGSVCPQRSYFCNNANCAVRRSAWEALAYDETLTGLEDLAWAREAQARGGWIAYQSEAEIIHVHEESWEKIENRYRREAIAMRTIDSHASFTWWDMLRLMVANIVADSRAAIAERAFTQELSSIVNFRFRQLWGTYKGYKGSPEISAELRQRFYFPVTAADLEAAERKLCHRRIDYDALEAEAKRRTVEFAARAVPVDTGRRSRELDRNRI